jgi:hypothetical protein
MLMGMEPVAHVPEGVDAVQWVAPVANTFPWWQIALGITLGCAVLAWGLRRTFRGWRKRGWMTPKWAMISELGSVGFTMVVGLIVGWRVWDAWLGAMCGLVGGASAGWFMRKLDGFLAKRFGLEKDSLGETTMFMSEAQQKEIRELQERLRKESAE